MSQDLNIRLKQLISLAPCMIFMKGDPKQPKCGRFTTWLCVCIYCYLLFSQHTGFSKQVVALLQEMNVDFTSFDILGDEDVRQGTLVYVKYKLRCHVQLPL